MVLQNDPIFFKSMPFFNNYIRLYNSYKLPECDYAYYYNKNNVFGIVILTIRQLNNNDNNWCIAIFYGIIQQ